MWAILTNVPFGALDEMVSRCPSWRIVETPVRIFTKLRVVIVNPGQKEETYTFALNQKI